MSMQCTVSALLTSMRNGQAAKKEVVKSPCSNLKVAILNVLKEEGYIEGYKINEISTNIKQLEIKLKYYNGKPVMTRIDRASRPGLRRYRSAGDLPKVLGGLGLAIISTSKGVVSDKKARELGEGGEVLAIVE